MTNKLYQLNPLGLVGSDTEQLWKDFRPMNSKLEALSAKMEYLSSKLESTPLAAFSTMNGGPYASPADIRAIQMDIHSLQEFITALREHAPGSSSAPLAQEAQSVYQSPLGSSENLGTRMTEAERKITRLLKFVRDLHRYLNAGDAEEEMITKKKDCNFCLYCPAICNCADEKYLHRSTKAPIARCLKWA